MQLPIVLDGAEKATLQTQIFDQIRTMILEGRLRIGDPLPATRELSCQMGISRNTAVLAYERLIAEGYVATRPHVGTYVAAGVTKAATSFVESRDVDISQNGGCAAFARTKVGSGASPQAHFSAAPWRRRLIADFRVDRSDPRSFPLKAWSQHVGRRLKAAASPLTEYDDPAGLWELRRAIAAHLGPARGVIAEPDQIVIVGGRQDGLHLVARLLVEPDTTAVIESPCNLRAALALECFGARLHPLPVDREGLDAASAPRVRGAIAYVTPSRQYPLGVTLSLHRRMALLSWASEHEAHIVEDDRDGDFRFAGSPLTALKGLDRNERTIYVGAFSKSMGPGLRLGYVVLPRRLIARARRLATLVIDGRSWLEQAAMADFMTSGGFAKHLRRLRKLYLARRDALLGALKAHFGACEILGDEAGTHLVWRLPRGFAKASEVEARALEASVGVYTLASADALHLGSRDESDRLLMLGFGALDEREIATGVARLAFALQNAGGSKAI